MTTYDKVSGSLASREVRDGFAFLFALNQMGSPLYKAYAKMCDGENNADLTNALNEAFNAGLDFARRENIPTETP